MVIWVIRIIISVWEVVYRGLFSIGDFVIFFGVIEGILNILVKYMFEY